MGKLIELDTACDMLNRFFGNAETHKEKTAILEVKQALLELRSVELVRCKDCKYRHDSCFAGNGYIYCDIQHTYFSLEGFCCYGERKDNDR